MYLFFQSLHIRLVESSMLSTQNHLKLKTFWSRSSKLNHALNSPSSAHQGQIDTVPSAGVFYSLWHTLMKPLILDFTGQVHPGVLQSSLMKQWTAPVVPDVFLPSVASFNETSDSTRMPPDICWKQLIVPAASAPRMVKFLFSSNRPVFSKSDLFSSNPGPLQVFRSTHPDIHSAKIITWIKIIWIRMYMNSYSVYMNSYKVWNYMNFFMYEFICFMKSYMNPGVQRFQSSRWT